MLPCLCMRRSARACPWAIGGFALAEALVAIAVVMTFSAGVLPLFVTTRGALEEAHLATTSAVLARSKLDQLRSLSWNYHLDQAGNLSAVTDDTTNLATDPPLRDGSGLQPSPAGSLWASMAGYVDFADAQGASIGGGTERPPGARYVRRWAVSTLPGDPDTLVLQVRVVPICAATVPTGEIRAGPLRGETWLVTLETRTRP